MEVAYLLKRTKVLYKKGFLTLKKEFLSIAYSRVAVPQITGMLIHNN